MDPVLGKLKNRVSGEELPFCVNPTDYRLTRTFNFDVDSCLGQPAPVVSYREGGASELTSHLIFDTDANPNTDIQKLKNFVKNLNKIDSETRSTPVLEYVMGNFNFKGYVKSYGFHASRFNARGEVTHAVLSLALISNGEFEDGKE